MRSNRLLAAVIASAWSLFLFAMPSVCECRDLGIVGKVYPIAESDAVEEMKAKAAKVDWKKHLSKIKPENYRPADTVSLPRASAPRKRLVDMTYTLEHDLPDEKGGILYPKGYAFNPLDLISYPKTIVVLDGEDRGQLKWFAASPLAGKVDIVLLITKGPFVEVTKKLKRPVFYADGKIADKFNLEKLPATIKQVGRYMEVTEYVVQDR